MLVDTRAAAVAGAVGADVIGEVTAQAASNVGKAAANASESLFLVMVVLRIGSSTNETAHRPLIEAKR
jgi:ABC-type phosphate/phosphonate transport system permease subunit